jgi:nitroimidazol reductase NimA-like FMN-containing flavoprotein (pyridoxamine 5'-phosphate oxidase superfamily)
MRRSDRQIREREEIDAIIRRCSVCRLALCDGVQPYIVPLSFGYDGSSLYFHGALTGRKVEILKKNNRVCFEFDIMEQVLQAEQACGWSMQYQSVIGFGRGEIVTDVAAKAAALACIMAHYSDNSWTFGDGDLAKILVVRVEISEMTGKKRSA